MKKSCFQLFLVFLVAGLLTGCVVMSVYPYYTVTDLTFDAGLSGRWAKSGATNEFWEFTPVTNQYYLVSTVDAQETNRFDGYLFQLKGQPFLDLCTTNRDGLNQLPLHLAVKVTRHQDQLELAMLNYEWLGKLLAANPATLRHIVVPDKPLETNRGEKFYLTADTRDLQKFLLKHQNNTNAFTPLDQMQRLLK